MKLGLDDFKIKSNLTTFSSTSSSISFNLTLNDLPNNKFGTIYTICNNSNLEFKKTVCEPHNDSFICKCDQLNISNTFYNISLVNQLENFDLVEKSIGSFNTS